jgi:uridine kinase
MPVGDGIVDAVAGRIVAVRREVPARRSALVAVTGIDGSGKGYLTARIVTELARRGTRAAGIGIDGWLNLPRVRFSREDPAGHFYRNAIRFEEMFSRLVFPLRDRRSIRLEADFAEETAREHRRHVYEYRDIDVIVLEGIYLLKREFQDRYDASFWVDCSFETALERALARGQEGLPPAAAIEAYRTIYFPAQEIHRIRDEPRRAATATVPNDPRLGP